jgi:ATP-dependent helicase/nuclease subunit B
VNSVLEKPQTPVRSIARAMYELLEALGARQQIVQWMQAAEKANRLEERGEHERVWDELVKLFDELVELFGDEPITLNDFSAIIDAALDGFELALAPPTVDQVLVGPVDRTRTGNVKACAVLGLSEGQFPRSGSEGTVFTDADRRTLAKNKIDLDPDSQRQLLDERFLEYIAFTRASHKLLLTRSTVDGGGRAIGPSAFWISLASRGIIPQAIAQETELSLATPRQLIVTLMQWVRDGKLNESLAAIYQWLATHTPRPAAIESIQNFAWPALSYRNIAHLEPARASAIFPSPLKTTIRELESFRRCPYQHFAAYGLGLRDRQQRRVSGRDLSAVYHHVLDRLVQDLIRAKTPLDKIQDEQVRRRISELTLELGRDLRSELMLSTARNRYLLNHIQRTLASVLAAQKAAAARGEFLPGFVNVHFGGEKCDIPALQIDTPAGNLITITGKIDRVDVLPDGSASVVDYHLNVARLHATDAFHGLALQLLTHLLVLESAGEHAPAAAFSVQLLRWMRAENPDDAISPDDPKFHLLIKPRGIFDARFLKKLDKDFAGGRSDVVQAMVRQDGQLGNIEHNDACGEKEFTALLKHVRRRVADLADRIVAGDIGIRPFRIGNTTPCASCDFRAICRFEPAPGGYDDLPAISRVELLARVVEENP